MKTTYKLNLLAVALVSAFALTNVRAADIAPAVKKCVALGCHAYIIADGFLLNTQRTQSSLQSKAKAARFINRVDFASVLL